MQRKAQLIFYRKQQQQRLLQPIIAETQIRKLKINKKKDNLKGNPSWEWQKK